MSKHPVPRVREAAEIIGDHLDAILSLFKPGKKITVVVRDPEAPDHSRDLVQTNDDIDEAIKALARRKIDNGTLRGDV
jgi:hypothetical protein